MNRKKQILIFILIIPLLLTFFMRMNGYFFTAEGVLHATERGLLYGPSDRILAELPVADGGRLMLGRVKGGISAIPVQRRWAILWGMKDGYISGYQPCEKEVSAFSFAGKTVAGISTHPEVSQVFCRLEYRGENSSVDDTLTSEVTMTVDEEGFFLGDWRDSMEMGDYIFICYTEGRNAEGEVIYRDGVAPDGSYYYDGQLQQEEQGGTD